MELLHNGYVLNTPPGTFPLSTDSMVLGHFVRLPKNARVLDLGAGCGTLGLLLCAKDPGCTVTGVELMQDSHTAAEANIAANGLQNRLDSICADIRTIPSLFSPGSFTTCVSNPPYFSGGEASRENPLARRDDRCDPDTLFRAAAWALQFGGDFFLVHKPEKMAQLIGCAVKEGLEPKRLLLLRHKPDTPISIIALQCRKGGKPGLILEEAALFDANGAPTPYHRQVYHLD